MTRRGWRRVLFGAALLTTTAVLGTAAVQEARTFRLEARLFSALGSESAVSLREGPNPAARFPDDGPSDHRLGYSDLGDRIAALSRDRYAVEMQAVVSPAMDRFTALGGFMPYREKTQAGLTLYDRTGQPLYEAHYPEKVFRGFDDVPKLVADTLMFIENRELLDPSVPRRNPAVEWDRFLLALATLPLQWVDPDRRTAGGSTLATQIEKYRHSAEGRTDGAGEKLRQMISASARAYLDGEDTSEARRRILVDYLNSTPLAARGGFGEVNGLGDGLWVWFGTDLDTARTILSTPAEGVAAQRRRALVYKQVLALILAQRRPSYYLVQDRDALDRLANAHLTLLADAGVIDGVTRDWALMQKLAFREDVPQPQSMSFVRQKAPNALRNRLLTMLDVPGLYELDRLDLTVASTLDGQTQERVVDALRRLNEASYISELGLTGKFLLDVKANELSKLVYSFTLYERGNDANYLRVQADNLDQPLDINEGAKLDLGSTAKLRTTVAYFQIVSELHTRYAHLSADVLRDVADEADDPLTRWATEWLASAPDRNLSAMLEAAWQRKYSANPHETFFTGGGIHAFVNFDHTFDNSVIPLEIAFRNSVNLPFVRLMRDIVAYLTVEGGDDASEILSNEEHPARQGYLERFADKEGTDFLNRFYAAYRKLSPDEALARLASRTRPIPQRLAVVFRSVRPNGSEAELGDFLRAHLPADVKLGPNQVAGLYAQTAPGKYSLNDLGYLARLHPLELWLVAWLAEHPGADRKSVLEASAEARQKSYSWLFSAHRGAQNTRIRITLEQEAFKRLHTMWKSVGYPFDTLVPSLATAIGSSADRPAALAELMGVIVNDGIRRPTVRITKFHFAEGTPYEAVLGLGLPKTERVLAPEICAQLRKALGDVAQNGTARRVWGAFTDGDGHPLPMGGKTGTGDARYERVAANGSVIDSRAVARTATFVFYLGDRFFGTMTAFVQGEDADKFHFTSALPAQLLKSLAPSIQPLLTPPPLATAETR